MVPLADVLAELAGRAAGGGAVALAVLVDGAEVAQAAVVDHDLPAQVQFAAVEQGVGLVDAPAQLREAARLRLEEEGRVLGIDLAEARHQRIVARCTRLLGILQRQHELVSRGHGHLPLEVGAALGEGGEGALATIAGAQVVDLLRSHAQREAHAFATTGDLRAADQRIVGAGGDGAQAAAPPPVLPVETHFGREHLHDAAHRVAAVQRARRAANHFDALQALAVDQGDVLVRCVAEDRVVQAEAVDQMQHFRALQATDDDHALPRRGLLDEGADLAVERVHRRLRRGLAEPFATDDRRGGRDMQGRFGAFGGGDLDGVETGSVTRRARTGFGGERLADGERQQRECNERAARSAESGTHQWRSPGGKVRSAKQT